MWDRRTVTVVVDEAISESGAEDLADLFASAGLEAEIEATYPADETERVSAAQSRRAVTRTDATGYFDVEQSWTVLVYTPVNQLIQEISPDGTRKLTEAIWSSRTRHTGVPHTSGLVMLVDEDTGIRISLESQLPLHAYKMLSDLKLTAFRSDPLSYERIGGHEGRWRSPR